MSPGSEATPSCLANLSSPLGASEAQSLWIKSLNIVNCLEGFLSKLGSFKRLGEAVFCEESSQITDLMSSSVINRGAGLCLVVQSCLTLCNLVDCSPPGSTVLGDSPGKNTGVGSLSHLQGIFLIQESNLGLLHGRQILHQLNSQGSPKLTSFIPKRKH